MAFDSIALTAVKSELEALVGSRVARIQQPAQQEIVLTMRGPQGSNRLLISAHPERARVHLTTASYTGPTHPPGFCMYLRRHLEGSRLTHVNRPESERIVRFQFTSHDQLGDEEPLVLIAETMGRHSNIIVVDQKQNLILAAIKPITADISRYRQILPGQPYKSPPPQNKLLLPSINELQFYSELRRRGRRPAEALLATIAGLSPLWAKELVTRSGLQDILSVKSASQTELAPLWRELTAFSYSLAKAQFNPVVYLQPEGRLLAVAPMILTRYTGLPVKSFSTMSAALDYYFQAKEIEVRFKSLQQSLLTKVRRHLERVQKKFSLHEEAIQGAKKADCYRKFGELLLAYAHNMKNAGLKEIMLTDWNNPNQQVLIRLDPALTPVQNAQRYFARYQKAKKTLVAAKRQKRRDLAESAYLESVLLAIRNTDELTELEEIKIELMDQGYIRKEVESRHQQRKIVPDSKPLSFVVEGYTILVGKNNRQNDYLAFRLAQNHDIWLHTQNIPGAHVLIRCSKNKLPPTNVLLAAAHLAAYYSRARTSSNVPVDYTKRRYLKKPQGSRPGFVTYTQQETLYITPDLNIIRALKDNP
ncbi:MAG TPA: NFACT RNA binding domain-containing protein [bacterium]|nr:NFACT RNA binding domain-containing protein [bacterium]